MKRILFAACAVIFMACTSCNDNATVAADKKDPAIEKNIAACHAVNKAFETGDVSALDSVIAPDFVDHTDRGDMKGADSLKAMVKMVHATNKDMNMEIIREIADADYVYTWMRFKGTHDGSMMAAGPYDMTAMQVTRFKDGKAVEHWEFMEPREMMKMMAKMPPPPPAKTDANKAKK
jgi:predicted SnoaL-like aldol condensation-catalyzing enzyme